jgi:hypothetical protein
VDVFTFLGWALLFLGAYKLGVYVERKLKAKAQERQAQVDAEASAPADEKPKQ